MPVDLSGLSYFLPIAGFLFVFAIVYALLDKTKILGDNKPTNLIIAAIIAVIFSTLAPAQRYVEKVTPWFAILALSLFFILIIIGLSQQEISNIMKPWFVWIFIALLILIFLISAVSVFPALFGNIWFEITKFVTLRSQIAGGIILLIIAGITAWIISK